MIFRNFSRRTLLRINFRLLPDRPGFPPPGDFPPQMNVGSSSRPPSPPGHFLPLFTPEGRPHFFNPALNQTSWLPPPGFPPAMAGPVPPFSRPPFAHQPLAQEEEKPVAMKKIPGTDWRKVTTNLGSHYFHNPTTKETSWTVPADLVDVVCLPCTVSLYLLALSFISSLSSFLSLPPLSSQNESSPRSSVSLKRLRQRPRKPMRRRVMLRTGRVSGRTTANGH